MLEFKDLIGNNKIKTYLKKTVLDNQVLHSYIFEGVDGIGKSLFAKEFAKMILCLDAEKICNKCKSCISFDGNNHPDFIMIEPDDGKSIKIDQIRLMQEKVLEKPIISGKKVYIINDAETMTKESQNCLLKTLEEPPEYVVIILIVSNKSKLLTTVKSRCIKIQFEKLTDSEINSYLKNDGIKELNEPLLEQCDGSLKKALLIGDKSEEYSSIENIIKNMEKENIATIWNNSNILYKSQDEINDFLDYINVILYNKLNKTNEKKYINCIETVEKTKKNLLSNANYNMCIDNLLLKLWEDFNE